MKHAYREIGKIVLAGIVMVSLTAFVAKGWLLRELGNKMDTPHREYEKYQDFASTKAVCGREAPEIVRKGKRLAGMESGIYLLELRAMDGERRTAIGRFGLLVEGNI